MRKPSNNEFALITVIAGAILASILPWILTYRPWSFLDFSSTGPIGDTIGGIAGPVLNFAGLLVVYFSLREQTQASNSQYDLSQRSTSLDVAFKLIEHLAQQVSKNNDSLSAIGESFSVLDATWSDTRVFPNGPSGLGARQMFDASSGTAIATIENSEPDLQLILGLFDALYIFLGTAKLDKATEATLYRLLASVYAPVINTVKERPKVVQYHTLAGTINAHADKLSAALGN